MITGLVSACISVDCNINQIFTDILPKVHNFFHEFLALPTCVHRDKYQTNVRQSMVQIFIICNVLVKQIR